VHLVGCTIGIPSVLIVSICIPFTYSTSYSTVFLTLNNSYSSFCAHSIKYGIPYCIVRIVSGCYITCWPEDGLGRDRNM